MAKTTVNGGASNNLTAAQEPYFLTAADVASISGFCSDLPPSPLVRMPQVGDRRSDANESMGGLHWYG